MLNKKYVYLCFKLIKIKHMYVFYVKHAYFMDVGHKTHKYVCYTCIIFVSNKYFALFQKIC